MSPLVTRPSLPEPGTVAASIPLSADSLRTDGANGASVGGAFDATVAAAAAAAGAAAAGFGGGADLAAVPAAPSLIWPSNAPTATVSPSFAEISPSTPAEGAGTSMVTLSVSSSTKGSSTATGSPAFLNQRPIVASVTDSPRVGTRISVMVSILNNPCGHEILTPSPAGWRAILFGQSTRRTCSELVLGAPHGAGRKRLADDQLSASSSSALSWARCFDIKPLAVAAEAARP